MYHTVYSLYRGVERFPRLSVVSVSQSCEKNMEENVAKLSNTAQI